MFFTCDGRPQGCLWIHESAWAGIVAHGCFHAVAYTLKRVGLELTDESEESYAYYLQWMLNEILPKLDVWKGYAEFAEKERRRKRR